MDLFWIDFIQFSYVTSHDMNNEWMKTKSWKFHVMVLWVCPWWCGIIWEANSLVERIRYLPYIYTEEVHTPRSWSRSWRRAWQSERKLGGGKIVERWHLGFAERVVVALLWRCRRRLLLWSRTTRHALSLASVQSLRLRTRSELSENFSISLLIPFLSDSILFCACSLSVPAPQRPSYSIVSRLCGVVFLPNSADISCAGQAFSSHSLPFFSHLWADRYFFCVA
jgi:hypothetical protein